LWALECSELCMDGAGAERSSAACNLADLSETQSFALRKPSLLWPESLDAGSEYSPPPA